MSLQYNIKCLGANNPALQLYYYTIYLYVKIAFSDTSLVMNTVDQRRYKKSLAHQCSSC